jgi:hypothetical protein
MTKSRRVKEPRRSTSVPVAEQPTILWPVVSRLSPKEDQWSLSDNDIVRLEEAVGAQFTTEARRAINAIAAGWVAHDRGLQSPRPGDFKKRLQKMAKAASVAAALDLNRENAPSLDRHLFIWLNDAEFDTARDLLRISSSMAAQAEDLITLLEAVQKHLPPDLGRPRPMDDDRFIIYLADQFETTRIPATAYPTEHSDSHYGETPFRNFVHRFYAMLPLKKRRTQSGLDEAMIRALDYRRKNSE